MRGNVIPEAAGWRGRRGLGPDPRGSGEPAPGGMGKIGPLRNGLAGTFFPAPEASETGALDRVLSSLREETGGRKVKQRGKSRKEGQASPQEKAAEPEDRASMASW